MSEAADTPTVVLERAGAVATVRIDRPRALNALDESTLRDLARALRDVRRDADVRCVLVTGTGPKAFCAGADLKAIETFGPRMEDPRGPLGVSRVISPKPTIAAISGWCLAGGLELALWCDLRIATQESALGFPERRWGVPLVDGGTQRLPRIVGLGRALDLILTGRIVDADEAFGMGLLTEIVPAGRHVERALEYAEALARFPQDTMLADRRAAIEGVGLTFEEGLALEAENGRLTA